MRKALNFIVKSVLWLGVALLVLVGFTQLWGYSPLAAQIVIGLILGFSLLAVTLAAFAPLYAGSLVNKPSKDGPSGPHFFTFPEEGKAKIIVRGDRIIRMVMIFGGHRFQRDSRNPDATRENAAYWEIEETPRGQKDEDPLAGIVWFLKPWARYVYNTTGAVFTGIYPFQTVHEYPLERTKVHRNEHEDEDSEKARKMNNMVLEVVNDYSDHFRVQEFLYPFRVPAADTKDKVPLNILAVLKVRTKNPFKAAYATTRWDLQTVNLANNAVTNFGRAHTFDQVLVAETPEQARELNEAVEEIRDDEEVYGIDIVGVDLLDLSPNLSPEDKSKLYAEVIANSLGKATERDGLARANALRELNKAIDEGGPNSVQALGFEALVRAAEAAKGGTVILGGNVAGGTESQTLAAILAELRKQNNSNQGANP